MYYRRGLLVAVVMLSACANVAAPETPSLTLTAEEIAQLREMLQLHPEQQRALAEWQKTQDDVQRWVDVEAQLKQLILALDNMVNGPQSSPEPVSVAVAPAPPPPAPPLPPPVEVEAVMPQAPVLSAETKVFSIQLGAFSQEAAAKKFWMSLVDKYPALLAELPGYAQPIEVAARQQSTYRLKVGRFAAFQEADKICRSLSSLGQSCFVASGTLDSPRLQRD